MRQSSESNLSRMLSSRPLVLKRKGLHICLHDAFSGEALAGQVTCELIQEPGKLPVIRAEFICDGRYVRLGGDD